MKNAFLLLVALSLTQCTGVTQPNSYAPAPASGAMLARCEGASPIPPSISSNRSIVIDERPGLGTQLGHEVYQKTIGTHFYRRNQSMPDAMASFQYNDEEGAKLMARMGGASFQHGGSFDLVPGKLRVTVKGSSWTYGQTFKHYLSAGRYIVVGRPGATYELIFTNLTRNRLEIVTSVDGLDVRSGRPASVKSSGYVIAAKSSVSIPGMRVGGVLRAFQFSSVADSRAATSYGEKGARNVGVIGVGLYEEDELQRRRVRVEENYLREGARAFGN